jgi:hypothetical protein
MKLIIKLYDESAGGEGALVDLSVLISIFLKGSTCKCIASNIATLIMDLSLERMQKLYALLSCPLLYIRIHYRALMLQFSSKLRINVTGAIFEVLILLFSQYCGM